MTNPNENWRNAFSRANPTLIAGRVIDSQELMGSGIEVRVVEVEETDEHGTKKGKIVEIGAIGIRGYPMITVRQEKLWELITALIESGAK